MGGEWLNVKIKFGALAAIVPERRECQVSVASDEGTSGWRGQQLEGDHLLKGVVCVQKAGYPPPGIVGAERRYWKNKVVSNPSPITETPGFRKRAGSSARNDQGGGRGSQTKVTAPPAARR